MLLQRLLLLLGVSLLLIGCKNSKPKTAELGRIYNRSAQAHGPDRNPVIVIPGVLGSRLVETNSGRVLWGAFGGKAIPIGSRFSNTSFARPMPAADAPLHSDDGVTNDGPLGLVELNVVGIPLRIRAYEQILRALGTGGYRDEVMQVDELSYGQSHFTCFQFDYDWRLDNAGNAARLQAFIHEKRQEVAQQITTRYGVAAPEVKFDIIAHSMGGLLTRYFLRYGDQPLGETGPLPEPTWAGAKQVGRVVLVGTPNAGSIKSFVSLRDGLNFGPLGSVEPGVVATMPSIYQSLPRPRHKPVLDEDGEPIDHLDPAVWSERRWGLNAPDQGPLLKLLLPDLAREARKERAALHTVRCLRLAKRFFEALDAPLDPPDDLSLRLFLGDAEGTPAVVQPDGPRKTIHLDWQPGDGTVLRSSALMDERVGGEWQPELKSPIRWRNVTMLFEEHLGLTQSAEFHDNVLYHLLEEPRRSR